MNRENSFSEAGMVAPSEAMSGEAQGGDDHFSDDEQGAELEALQNLPPDERRRALRRLRNRESARRVRARRIQEMSHMEGAVACMQEENAALKAHVSKLQNHIQSMTLKIYEVTAKYEAAVAENAQLRAQLHRTRQPSGFGDSSFVVPAASAGAVAGTALNPAAEPEASPFVAQPQPQPLVGRRDSGSAGQQSQLGGQHGQHGPAGLQQQQHGQGEGLSAGHAQLRASSPMDVQQQKAALEEVVALLQAHKRRTQGAAAAAAQDRVSAASEIASCDPQAAHKLPSPALDAALQRTLPLLGQGQDGGGGAAAPGGAAAGAANSGSGGLPGQANGNGNAHVSFKTEADAHALSRLQYSGSSGVMGQVMGGLSLNARTAAAAAAGGVSSGPLPGVPGGGGGMAGSNPFAGAQGGRDGSMCHVSLSASANIGQLPSFSDLPLAAQPQLQLPECRGIFPGAPFTTLAQHEAQQQLLLQQHHQAMLLQQQAAMQGHAPGHVHGHSFVPLQTLPEFALPYPLQQQQLAGHGVGSFGLSGFGPAGGAGGGGPSLLPPSGSASGVMYSGMSAASACFYSANSMFQHSGSQLLGQVGQQPGAAGAGVGASSLGAGPGGGGTAMMQHARSSPLPLLGNHHHHHHGGGGGGGGGGTACAVGSNVVAAAAHAPHAGWQTGGGAGGGAGLAGALRSGDIPDDLFMSLDEYVPQDL